MINQAIDSASLNSPAPELIWLYTLSDTLITLACYCISIAFAYFAWCRQNLKFRWLYLTSGTFTSAPGTLIVLPWQPLYWLVIYRFRKPCTG